MVETRSQKSTPSPSSSQSVSTSGVAKQKATRGKGPQRASSVPPDARDKLDAKSIKTANGRRPSGPTSRLEVYITTRPGDFRSRPETSKTASAHKSQASAAPQDATRSASAHRPISKIHVLQKPEVVIPFKAPAKNLQPQSEKKPLSKDAPALARKHSLSSLQTHVTAALNSPARNAIVSGSGSSGQPPNKKRKISEVGAADSQEAAFVPRPKPSILSYGQSLEKAYQVTYLAHKAQMDASKGAATGSRRMDAGSSAAVAAGTVATTSPSPTRRTVSTAVGLLTPAASASNASVSSVASSKPGEGPSQQPEEVPSPSQRKDKGKQRAQDPPPSHVRDSPREATEPASPERPAKKPRVAPFEIHEIDAGAEDTFSSAIDGGSTMEDYGESDGASTGFQMLDFADLLSFPWAFTKVPFDVASMYVPMGTKAAFDSMQLAFEAESQARRTAETDLVAEIQKNFIAERRIAELEHQRDALMAQLEGRAGPSSLAHSALNPSHLNSSEFRDMVEHSITTQVKGQLQSTISDMLLEMFPTQLAALSIGTADPSLEDRTAEMGNMGANANGHPDRAADQVRNILALALQGDSSESVASGSGLHEARAPAGDVEMRSSPEWPLSAVQWQKLDKGKGRMVEVPSGESSDESEDL